MKKTIYLLAVVFNFSCNQRGRMLISRSSNQRRWVLSLTGLSIMLISCEKTFLGEEPPNEPVNNFEIFWNDLDQHYSLFTVRNIDWDELYQTYRPQVTNDMSDEELWDVLTAMMENLDDSHTTLYNGNIKYKSGYALNEQSISEISKELIVSKYLDFHTEIPSEDNLSYGKIKDKDIGYIYLGTMDGPNPSAIDDIMNQLEKHQAIILDVRQNTGGDDRYSARISKAFSDGKHFAYTVQTRNGRDHDDFDDKKLYYTGFDEGNTFTKPVVVLTDRKTISAGEIFLLHMKSFDHVTQIGDTTAGDFSTVSNMRFLPNGWHYRYSIQKILLPNGESLDGIGHVPDIYLKNTVSDINSGNDKVIEKATQYLLEEYGIE